MKVLRLTNSQDFDPRVEEDKRSFKIAERMLAEASGEEVETIRKKVWPTPDLPEIVNDWMERYDPEMVVVQVSGFWYTFDSSMMKIRRRFSRVGAVTTPAIRMSYKRTVAHTAPYRATRRFLMRTVGAEPFFTTDHVVERMEACLRRILAREPIGVVMRVGPAMPFDSIRSNQLECQRRWYEVNGRLKEICAKLHVTHIAREQPVSWKEVKQWYLFDHLHFGEEEHARRGDEEGRALVEAWERSLGKVV